MDNLVSAILNQKFDSASEALAESFEQILTIKLHEMKKMVAAKMVAEATETEEQLDESRIKIVKARVRGGKVQRRKKVSNVAGMTIRGGKLTRMSPAERRKRKMGARKAKIKRKSKMSRALMKRKRSMMRRKAMGL